MPIITCPHCFSVRHDATLSSANFGVIDAARHRQFSGLAGQIGHAILPAMAVLVSLFTPGVPALAQVPQVSEVMEDLYEDLRKPLMARRAALVVERGKLMEDGKTHNGRCRNVPENSGEARDCAKGQAELLERLQQFRASIDAFEDSLDTAVNSYGQRMIRSMLALAQALGWGAAEQQRLSQVLNRMGQDGADASRRQIQDAWQAILKRGPDSEMAQAALAGSGPGLPGAGTQTHFQDCAIFALANASGHPYGVVAARAAELISKGDWRHADARANPQKAIERRGLYGGEVIMVAEAFGRVELVRSENFSAILRGGRNIIVNVVPGSGRFTDGHAVVLTRTFEHGGQTWFELMDSNQGPIRRLYASQRELGRLLKENGITYGADPKRTPQLLR
jgi:hypothetical protein